MNKLKIVILIIIVIILTCASPKILYHTDKHNINYDDWSDTSKQIDTTIQDNPWIR